MTLRRLLSLVGLIGIGVGSAALALRVAGF